MAVHATVARAALPQADALANADTIALLSAAKAALDELEHPAAGDGAEQPRVNFDAAVDSLTELYQLHGCRWAGPELVRLYARPEVPQLRIGFSADGRVELRVEPLELRNPVFADYTVLLCTLTSHTAQDVRAPATSTLRLTLPDGTPVPAQAVTPQHPLWPHLSRQAATFSPPDALPSGAGIAFKQLFAIPRASLPLNTCAVSLAWGGYDIQLPTWAESQAREAGRGGRRQ